MNATRTGKKKKDKKEHWKYHCKNPKICKHRNGTDKNGWLNQFLQRAKPPASIAVN